RVSGSADRTGWLADATLDRLPLGTWLTQVADPYLSLEARADSATGTRVIVESLVLESDNSRLTGAATVDPGVPVILQAQVDLGDLRIGGADLHGLMRGPVVLTAPSLNGLATANVTAQLDAAAVGITALDASVSGSLQLGGNLSDLVVNAALRGNGALTGGLSLSAAPSQRRIQLRSDRHYQGVATDVEVRVDQDGTRARGQVRYQDLVMYVSDDSDGLALTGAGRLDGWTITVEPDLGGATVRGTLDRLVPGAAPAAGAGATDAGGPSGRSVVDLTLGDTSGSPRSAGEPWLRGAVTGLAIAGQELGDVAIVSDAPGEAITVTGAALLASFAPSTSEWSLSLEDQALAGDLEVSLSAAGHGLGGSLSGSA